MPCHKRSYAFTRNAPLAVTVRSLSLRRLTARARSVSFILRLPQENGNLALSEARATLGMVSVAGTGDINVWVPGGDLLSADLRGIERSLSFRRVLDGRFIVSYGVLGRPSTSYETRQDDSQNQASELNRHFFPFPPDKQGNPFTGRNLCQGKSAQTERAPSFDEALGFFSVLQFRLAETNINRFRPFSPLS